MTSYEGHIGIGVSAPGFPLTFSSGYGDKISLNGAAGDHYGFGMQSKLLQIHSNYEGADIAFGYGQSSAMTETMRIKGNGNVGIGVSTPESKLTVAGDASIGDHFGVGMTSPGVGRLQVRSGSIPNKILDQQQPDHDQVVSLNQHWQSFEPAVSGKLVALELRVIAQFTGILTIRAGEGTGGVILAQQTIYADNPARLNTFTIEGTPELTAGQRYTWQVDVDSDTGCGLGIQYSNAYADGRSGYNATYDYEFKTYKGITGAEKNALYVDAVSGNVGVGTAAPGFTLHVNGTLAASDLPLADYNNVQWDNVTGQFSIDNSSRRYKENIQPLADDFQRLLLAEPMTYTRPGSPDRWEIGYIAEEIDALGLKPLVMYDREGKPDSVNYEKMVLYLNEIARGQRAELESQRADIAGQRAEISELKAKNAEMEARLKRLEEAVGR